ncbi:MAG: T9SS type A sorting domain-containing protein [Phycisphaerae bacterium]|nr:T9SS type A sorting domain-containing protein [Saprospiraceae bacterium]
MKKISTSLLLLIFFAHQAYAQLSIEWQKQIGGSGDEWPRNITPTMDGGTITIGESNSNDGDASGLHGFYDVWVVKTDASGTIEWQRMYGGSAGDFGKSIMQTKDGGYIFSALAYSIDGDISSTTDESDCWVVKIDAFGNIEWEKSFSAGGVSLPCGIVQTEDGGYVVAAYGTIYDFWFFKIDAQGNLVWEKFYGGTKEDRIINIKSTLDKGFILVGGSKSNDGDLTGHYGPTDKTDFWVVKTDSNGDLEWQKNLGGSFLDEAHNVLVTSDGGYLIGGPSQSNDWDVSGHHGMVGIIDSWIVKLDAQGNILWSRSLGGSAGYDNAYRAFFETADGGYVLAGSSNSPDGDLIGLHKGEWDCWILKLSQTGDIIWQKVFGSSGGESLDAMAQTSDGNFVMSGTTSIIDGDVTVPPHPSPNSDWKDFWIVKLNMVTGTEDLQKGSLQVFPNPFSESFSIAFDSESPIDAFTLFNLVGQKVFHSNHYDGKPIDGSSLPKGWYLLSAQTENGKTLQAKMLRAD